MQIEPILEKVKRLQPRFYYREADAYVESLTSNLIKFPYEIVE